VKKAVKIEIERAEGTASECVKRVVNSWSAANALLNSMSRTAPGSGGGYHKTDFKITFEDGETYGGRVDLNSEKLQNLGRHVLEFAECYSGRKRPAHVSEEDYRKLMAMYDDNTRNSFGRVLDEYDLDGFNS